MTTMPTGYIAVIPCVAKNAVQGIVQSLHVPEKSYAYEYGDLTVPGKISGLSWQDYKRFLATLGKQHVRHYFNQGTLEIMSPSKNHDILKKRLGRLIEMMAWSLKISIQSVGSMTVTSELTERGFEPDESYYIANEPKVRGKRSFEPDVDPPPDLIIEIEISRDCTEKFALYAAMKVPELWRFDGECLAFLLRSRRGIYREVEHSLAFPFLSTSDVTSYLEKFDTLGENEVVTEFVRHAKKRLREYRKQQSTE